MCSSSDEGPPPPGGACGAAGQATAQCPTSSPYNVRIRAADGQSAPCTIVPVSGTIQLRAVRSQGGGSYQWSTSSSRLTLENAQSHIVTVRAGNTPSPSRNAETIRLVFTPTGCAPLAPLTHRLSVIRVRFSEPAQIPFGYDDMDNTAVHHVSVARSDLTRVRCTIEGGANAFELDFRCDDDDIARPLDAPASTAFDLDISGRRCDREETVLRARCHCENGPECAWIYVNVYKQKRISATVAKVWDSHSTATRLQYPNLDVASAQRMINTKYKAAVAHLTLTDHSSSGGAVDVRYDLDNNGKLTYEIQVGGREIDAINAAFRVSGQRVIIVRDLMSLYYLSANAAVGDTTLRLKSAYSGGVFLRAGDPLTLGSGANAESGRRITNVSGTTLTISPGLQFAHTTSEGVEFPAAGWSGNPIICMEGSTSEDEIKWTIGHECGHSLLRLVDVDATTDIMHFQQGATDHRLRYKPLNKHYTSGTENQWQRIDRD